MKFILIAKKVIFYIIGNIIIMKTMQIVTSPQYFESQRPDDLLTNMVEKRNLFRSPSNQMKSNESSLDSVKLSPMSIPPKKKEPFTNMFHIPQILTKRQGQGFNKVWRASALRIIYLITKFLMKIRTPTDQYKFKLMTPKIYQVLSDLSSDYEFYQLNDMIRHRVGKIRKVWIGTINMISYILLHKLNLSVQLSVIMPDSVFKIIWDITVLAMIIINIFYIPMKLAFDLESSTSMIIDLLLDTLPSYVKCKTISYYDQVFVIEILLNFNTAYYHEGMIHDNRKEIFQFYLKGDFVWDLIVVIPQVMVGGILITFKVSSYRNSTSHTQNSSC